MRAHVGILAKLVCTVGLFIGASAARAQAPRRIAVRVRIVDTAGAPVAGAEVAVVRGLNTRLASGTSDAAGLRVLLVERDDDPYQVVARRVGYERGERFFARPATDTVAMQIELHRIPRELAPVTVTESENRSRRHYHLEADEIANSTRVLIDATDLVTKVRPEMMGSKDCPLANVWVNGSHIQFAPPNEIALMRRGKPPTAPPPPKLALEAGSSSGRPAPVAIQQRVADDPWSVLASIKPEHVLEVNYIDCFIADPVHKRGSENAVYVVLKPGIAFETGRGSFVVDTARTENANVLPPLRATALAETDSLPPYRHRLLGVYDARSGEPVIGADVIDLGTGTHARSSRTGTVSLFYLAEGRSRIRIHRDGYHDEDMDVVISPATPSPITTVLTPIP
jgi:hypothetical protein